MMSWRCGLESAWLRLVMDGEHRLRLRLVHRPNILRSAKSCLIILSVYRIQTPAPVECSSLWLRINLVQRGTAHLFVPTLSSGFHLLIG